MLSLVTGGCGFIGSHLVDALLARGHEVRVVDNFATGNRLNLSPQGPVRLLEGDIREPELLRRAMDGVDVVFHQAALPYVPRSIADQNSCHDVNATGTFQVLMAARDMGVRRVVFASSSSVYGDTAELPKRESMSPRPHSPYALAKLTGEHYCRLFHELYGLEAVALRYFNVFGPRQAPNSAYAAAIPKFIRLITAGERPAVYG